MALTTQQEFEQQAQERLKAVRGIIGDSFEGSRAKAAKLKQHLPDWTPGMPLMADDLVVITEVLQFLLSVEADRETPRG